MKNICLLFLVLLTGSFHNIAGQTIPASEYSGKELPALNKKLAAGWNTWNTRSVLSHVLLPEYFAINLQLKNNRSGEILEEALIGRRSENGKAVEKITPGDHAYDGSYTSLEIEWQGARALIQSAVADNNLVLLITPLQKNDSVVLIVQPAMLWDKKGEISKTKDIISVKTITSSIKVYITGNGDRSSSLKDNYSSSFLSNAKTGLSTGERKSIPQIEAVIRASKAKQEARKIKYRELPDVYNAMQRVLAWDVIYEPVHKRVIAPVSRIWNAGMWNGWVLFDWDTYFSSYMLSLDNKELAYSNAIAITHEITAGGFIPNFAAGLSKSNDRSQPPVGSLIIKELYKKYKEKWLLHEVFNDLLTWNRWWDSNRQLNGFLCWGSSPYKPAPTEPEWLTTEINKIQGAKWESGLDNSPMYDDVAFDTTKHIMLLADVGLMSLYINDCDNLAEIAEVIGKPDVAKEIKSRKAKYTASLQLLWDEKSGMFLNKNLENNQLSYRLSPTLFYPLLSGVATQQQADRMIREHFYNPAEFFGEYIIPSIARNDKAYKDQDYWRGRIWAPMNFLAYLGIRKYILPDARKDLVEKSKNLILKSWLSEGAVYENYNGTTGQGDDVGNSDKFYHWGALLSCISLIEEGYMEKPEDAIK